MRTTKSGRSRFIEPKPHPTADEQPKEVPEGGGSRPWIVLGVLLVLAGVAALGLAFFRS